MTDLIVRNLSVKAQTTCLVKEVSFSLKPGEFTVLIGPNGAGKSMTLRGLLGLVPADGQVFIGDDPLWTLSAAQRARRIAYLPQNAAMAWPVRVKDVVALGRFAHGAAPSRLSPHDQDAVQTALEECDLSDFADRAIDTLSGGELARVHCARAFCAQTPFLVADEPVAALDPAQTFRILDLLRQKANQGLGVLLVLHDIALAARYADRMIMMKDGCTQSDGPVETVLTPEALKLLFDVEARVDGREIWLSP